MSESIDSKIGTLSGVILATDCEEWEKRNKSLLSIIAIIESYRNKSEEEKADSFPSSVLRMLKEPVKSMISDLRSTQVRDVCQLLIVMSEVLVDKLKPFVRDCFGFILQELKVPNKVTNGYVGDALRSIIINCQVNTAIPLIATEIKESKAKLVRERCLEYLNEILMHWDLSDKDLEIVQNSVEIGLQDASEKAREIARTAYLNLYHLFPDNAARIKENLPKALQQRLRKAEYEDLVQLGLEPPVDASFNDSSFCSENKTEYSGATTTPAIHSSKSRVPNMNVDPLSNSLGSNNSISSAGTSSVHSRSCSNLTSSTASSRMRSAVTQSCNSSPRGDQSDKSTTKNTEARKTPHTKFQKQKSRNDIVRSNTTSRHNSYVGSSQVADSLQKNKIDVSVGDKNDHNEAVTIQSRREALVKKRQSVVSNPFQTIILTPPRDTTSTIQHDGIAGQNAKNSPEDVTFECGKDTDIASQIDDSKDLSSNQDLLKENDPSAMSKLRNPSSNGHMIHSRSTPNVLKSDAGSTAFKSGLRQPSPLKSLHNIKEHLESENLTSSKRSSIQPDRSTPQSQVVATPGTQESMRSAMPTPHTETRDSISTSENETTPVQVKSYHRSQSCFELSRGDASKSVASSFPDDLHLEMVVQVIEGAGPLKLPGRVKFIGHTSFANGVWIGVELVAPSGKNDGCVHGKRYFTCEAGHGIFIRREHIEIPKVIQQIPPNRLSLDNKPSHALKNDKQTPYQQENQSKFLDLNRGITSDTAPPLSPRNSSAIENSRASIVSHGGDTGSVQSVDTASVSSAHSNDMKGCPQPKKSTDILKLKLSKMMDLLNQQLELVVELDRIEEEEQEQLRSLECTDSSALLETQQVERRRKVAEIQRDIMQHTKDEADLIESFKRKFTKHMVLC